jgi:azurin
MRAWQMFAAVPALMVALVFPGCGDRNGVAPEAGRAGAPDVAASDPGTTGSRVTKPMQAFAAKGDVAEIAIEGNDLMQFNIKQFTVRPGQMVRLTLAHVGTLPAQAMGHNVVILWPDDDVFEFGADVGEHRGGAHDGYVPDALLDRVVAFTELIGGGQTATVEFRAPDDPAEYPFLCSFPGHFAQMNGNMVVKE